MATLSPTQGPPACAHKHASRCMLSIPGCCACLDRRPHTQNYDVYVDGVGSVPQGTRWNYYCDHCKAFWECQIRRAGISASLSRIPDFPRSSTLDSPRSPRRTFASAFSQMEHYLSGTGRSHRPLLGLGRASREESSPPVSLEERLQRHTSLRARGAAVSPPSSPGVLEESPAPSGHLRRIQRPQNLSISRVGDTAAEAPPSPISPEEPAATQNDIIRRQQRLQSLRNAAPERQYSNTSSEGSMDAQASTTTDDQEMPVQSRSLLSFVESRAHITDLENQLDRLHARMLGGRNAASARELQRNESERQRWSTSRGNQVITRPTPPRPSQVSTRPSRREALPINDETERTWSSVASVTSATTDNSNVSLEVQASRTPDRVLSQPALEPQSQSESTQTNSPQQADRSQPIWSLANSVQDIETELAHLSEGAARRSAELASLSQQLERQTRQYAAQAQRNAAEQGGNYDHNDILGRANEGLRRLRELRERRERGEQQEQIRRVWGNVDDDDYVSPVSALFQRSWEAYSLRQQAEQEGSNPSPTSVWLDAPVPDAVRAAIDASVTTPDPGSHRTTIDLATAANEASSLLQNFRENLEGDAITPDQQILIDRAVDGILQMRREVRSRARTNNRRPRRSRGGRSAAWEQPKGLDDDDSRPPPLEAEAMVVDCECKVCFGQIADTVLLPCSHLVLCGWCADQMGIRKLSEFSPRSVQCPICRTNVVDRIKVFRG